MVDRSDLCVFDANSNFCGINKAMFMGFSDLIVFPENKPVCIIDYKSDRKKSEETSYDYNNRMINKYISQQKSYALVFDELLGNVAQKMILYRSNANDGDRWLQKDYKNEI